MTQNQQAIEYWKDRMKYNANISIDYFTAEPRKLSDSQWYALMVVDYNALNGQQIDRDTRKFWDREAGRLGLEQTSGKQVYISKTFSTRFDNYRGETCVVTVADPESCCVL